MKRRRQEDKTLMKNCCPISLLPISGKIFERVIYNSLSNYFLSNKLFMPSQSGFLPGDSCIALSLSIIREIQTAFDSNPTVNVRGVFRLHFNHLNEHKFRHGFCNTMNPMCTCRTEVETTEHFLWCCQFYSTQRLELFENL